MEFKNKTRKSIQLDITPIVDTSFILLIFFALSLNFAPTSSLKINLPGVSSKEIIKQSKQIIIQITVKGEIFVDDTRLNIESLSVTLDKIKLKFPGSNIVLEADNAVIHGKVIQVMDICKNAGFEKISIAAYLK